MTTKRSKTKKYRFKSKIEADKWTDIIAVKGNPLECVSILE